MPMRTITMKKLKEVLRLKYDSKLSNRQIARALNMSAGTISYYTRAFDDIKLSWNEAKQLDEDQLITLLLPHCRQRKRKDAQSRYYQPDWADIHKSLKPKGVNLQLLWEEYKKVNKSERCYSYSQFCRHYRGWCMHLEPELKETHKAGEKCFIDYCGPRIPIYNEQNEKIYEAYIFVGILGASQYIFAQATKTRSLPDWIGAHVRMLEFFQGVPALLIPDNEKSGVTAACYYDPDINLTYTDFAHYYHTVILPTRARKPQDKGGVEKAVQIVETWIIAKLRKQRFKSLAELNKAIKECLGEINNKPFQKLETTRHQQFLAFEKEALQALPPQPYEFANFVKASVALNYRVQLNKHFYTVPHLLIRKKVECRLTAKLVEIFYKGKCVASHLRDDTPGTSTDILEHLPEAHRKHQEWTPQQFLEWAEHVGRQTGQFIDRLIEQQPHPECGYRQHNGFRRLQKYYGNERLNRACAYADSHALYRYRHVNAILKSNKDKILSTLTANDDPFKPINDHEHVRGAIYFSTIEE